MCFARFPVLFCWCYLALLYCSYLLFVQYCACFFTFSSVILLVLPCLSILFLSAIFEGFCMCFSRFPMLLC